MLYFNFNSQNYHCEHKVQNNFLFSTFASALILSSSADVAGVAPSWFFRVMFFLNTLKKTLFQRCGSITVVSRDVLRWD